MRFRLILSFILVVIIAIASVAMIARRQTVSAVNAFIYRGGLSGTEGLVSNLEDHYANYGSWEGVDTLFMRPGRGLGMGQGQNRETGLTNQRLQLADDTGRVLFDTQVEDPRSRISLTERNRAIRLEFDGQTIGYLLPETSFQISQIATQALVARINRAAFTAAILASVVALALALFLSYRLLRPVGELTEAAEKLATGDLSQRVSVHGGDEMATLANTFNNMAASLQIAETRRRALTADIAHELRTPLAVQRAHLEALEDGIYDLTLDSLTPIVEHNRLLTRLVEDLRMLALADSGQLELIRTPTEFCALVKRVVDRLEPQAAERLIKFDYSADENLPPLSLDSQRVEQILHNLFDNAMRYSVDGGVVNIKCSFVGDQCCLTIRDNGPGIPEDDLPYIFERFYRADKSRTRVEGGTGLGLSIARKIAQAHDGDLTAGNHPDGGAIFTLTLPVGENP
jgi:signal transduction histidine kinase